MADITIRVTSTFTGTARVKTRSPRPTEVIQLTNTMWKVANRHGGNLNCTSANKLGFLGNRGIESVKVGRGLLVSEADTRRRFEHLVQLALSTPAAQLVEKLRTAPGIEVVVVDVKTPRQEAIEKLEAEVAKLREALVRDFAFTGLSLAVGGIPALFISNLLLFSIAGLSSIIFGVRLIYGKFSIGKTEKNIENLYGEGILFICSKHTSDKAEELREKLIEAGFGRGVRAYNDPDGIIVWLDPSERDKLEDILFSHVNLTDRNGMSWKSEDVNSISIGYNIITLSWFLPSSSSPSSSTFEPLATFKMIG